MARLNVFITNLHAYVCGELRGEWLKLPATEEEQKAAWKRIGSPEEVFFTDYDSNEIPEITESLGEYENLGQLNELAEKLEGMEYYELDTLAAVLESGIASAHGAAELLELCEEVQDGKYNLVHGINNEEDLGYYYAEETGMINELPEWARGYFNYEEYGRDIAIEACGNFCAAGWIEEIA